MSKWLGVCGFVFLALVPSHASDWPRWRGPENTGYVAAGEAVPHALPAEAKPVWRVPVGGGLASPVVAGGRVFHLDNTEGQETAHALEADTGRELWRTPVDEAFRDGHSAPGPRCTPTVDGDRVYVQSCRGEFRCLAVADGQTLWRLNFVKDFEALFFGETGSASGASRHGNTGAPLVDGDRIYVAVGGTKGASVVCLDKRSGKVVWASENDTPGYAPLHVAELAGVRTVLAFTSVALIGLNANSGDLLWRVPIQTSLGRHIVTPIVAGDLVVVSSHEAGLVAVRVTRQGDTFAAVPAWTSRSAACNCATPVLVGNHLYGFGPSQRLECVDVRTGETAWAEKGFAPEPLTGDWAAFLVMGRRILMLGANGWLALFEADPAALRPVGSLRLCGRNWCHPAYAAGRLYVRDDKELLCVPLLP
jgi:outer membrane protein assembly factor BamB